MPTRELTRSNFMPAIFEDFFRPFNQWFDDGGIVRRIAHVPAVNIKNLGDHYAVMLAAPGLKKEDFHIDVDNNVLTISSEKKEEKEEKENNFTRREYSYTSFTRSFTLPEDVKQDAIEARYENGELQVSIPRRVEAKKAAMAKRIDVK
ncbi:MAG TPA: Hsp20/alpha crystallin family protein [Flavisolibacter sp.]|nr:Hsp20/alpha crystallin family protein [Flavisolibacter sp.]